MRFYVVQQIEGRLSLGRLETLGDRYSLVPLGPQPDIHAVARAILRDVGGPESDTVVQQLMRAFLPVIGPSGVFVSEAALRGWLAATLTRPEPGSHAVDPPAS